MIAEIVCDTLPDSRLQNDVSSCMVLRCCFLHQTNFTQTLTVSSLRFIRCRSFYTAEFAVIVLISCTLSDTCSCNVIAVLDSLWTNCFFSEHMELFTHLYYYTYFAVYTVTPQLLGLLRYNVK